MNARCGLVVAALVLLTGCSSGPPGAQQTPVSPAPSASTASPAPSVETLAAFEPAEPGASAPCPDEGFEQLVIPEEERSAALAIGDGEIGIVLGHQANARLCQWVPEAERLAALGYTVIIPNLQVDEPLPTYLAAEQWLRAEGVTDVVLVGASMGGMLAIASAAVVDDPPLAVIALSPPVAFRGVDARDFAADVSSRVLMVVGARDQDFPAQAEELADALASESEIITIDAVEHGVPLLDYPEVREQWDGFLAELAPVS